MTACNSEARKRIEDLYWERLRREGIVEGSRLAEHPEDVRAFGREIDRVRLEQAPAHIRLRDAMALWREFAREPEVCSDVRCIMHRIERREHDRRQRTQDSQGWAGTERRQTERRQCKWKPSGVTCSSTGR